MYTYENHHINVSTACPWDEKKTVREISNNYGHKEHLKSLFNKMSVFYMYIKHDNTSSQWTDKTEEGVTYQC